MLLIPPKTEIYIYTQPIDMRKQIDGLVNLLVDSFAQNPQQAGRVTGLNCWAHVRRKFMEALPNGEEKGVAGYVGQQIRKLYYLEDLIKQRNLDEQATRTVRQKMARPILERLKTDLDEKSRTSLPQKGL